uniref:Uncharacterized protein n=1 Tax=viral metagenome TaxID=1070528 RepID=A0A6C0EP77_9ZZZZ
MSTTTSGQNVPGMMLPTQKGMIGSNPKDSAVQSMNNMNQKQASLGSAVGGMRKRRKNKMNRGGSASTPSNIAVPQYQMQYQVQNGPGQDPNSQIQQNAQISTQGAANSAMDNYATQKGGNSNYNWGCYSGGKKRKTVKKLKKSRKSRKHRKKSKRYNK